MISSHNLSNRRWEPVVIKDPEKMTSKGHTAQTVADAERLQSRRSPCGRGSRLMRGARIITTVPSLWAPATGHHTRGSMPQCRRNQTCQF